jgi:RNA polymerase sigma factor (sigma-70 family)
MSKLDNKMIESNMGLVKKIASEYINKTNIDYEDLCQEGMLGLMKAVEKFDPTLGYQFSTYATWWIRQKIQRYIENSIPTSKKLAKQRAKIYAIRSRIERTGVEATYQMIADEVGLTAEEVASVLNIEHISIDSSISNEEGQSLVDVLESDNESMEEHVERQDMARMLRQIVDKLSQNERRVIVERYFANPLKVSTYEEVSEKLGVSRQRVQQLEKKALDKLKYTRELWNYMK